MGKYEDELREIAQMPRWQIPGVDGVKLALNQANITYNRVATESGFEGKTGTAIGERFGTAAKAAAANSDALDLLPTAVDAANAALLVAKYAYDDLPGADVDPEIKDTILKGSWAGGPLGALAGAAGVKIWENHLSDQREEAAKAALDELRGAIEVPAKSASSSFESLTVPETSNFDSGGASERKDVTFTDPPTGDGPIIATPNPKPKTAGPGSSIDVGTGIVITDPPPPVITDTEWPPPPTDTDTDTDTGSDDDGSGGTDDPIYDGSGPGTGINPGTGPSVDSGMDGGISGGGIAGGGLAGGIAGAAGIAGGARLAGQLGGGAGGLGGIGAGGLGAGGLGAGGFGSGGLAGGMGAGGAGGASGLGGARGATGMGAGGMGGNNIMAGGAGNNAAGAGGRGSAAGGRGGRSGMSSGRGLSSSGGSGAGGSASGRGGNNMMAPGQNGANDKNKKKRGTGLLGMTAPSLEEQDLPTGRSAAAGPGGRPGAADDDDES